MIHVGTAGWSVPRQVADAFPAEGSILQRYAAVFDAVEINSSFYRSHRPATYARWAEATPGRFRFALKAPRTITHAARLVDVEAPLSAFLAEAGELGPKLGPLLFQLPPSLAFDPAVAARFLDRLRDRTDTAAVLEPRHASWFGDGADGLLARFRIARVAADPAVTPQAARPGGWRGLTYVRLHGSPRMYASTYDEAALRRLADDLTTDPAPERWCIFDNTMLGAAAANALDLRARL